MTDLPPAPDQAGEPREVPPWERELLATGLIPEALWDEALYNHLGEILQTYTLPREVIIRTLAWVLGAALCSDEQDAIEQRRLEVIALLDIVMILRGGP